MYSKKFLYSVLMAGVFGSWCLLPNVRAEDDEEEKPKTIDQKVSGHIDKVNSGVEWAGKDRKEQAKDVSDKVEEQKESWTDWATRGASKTWRDAKNKANGAWKDVRDSNLGKWMPSEQRDQEAKQRMLNVFRRQGLIDSNGHIDVGTPEKERKLQEYFKIVVDTKLDRGWSKGKDSLEAERIGKESLDTAGQDDDGYYGKQRAVDFWNSVVSGKDVTGGDEIDKQYFGKNQNAFRIDQQLKAATAGSEEYTLTSAELGQTPIKDFNRELGRGVEAGVKDYVKIIDFITGAGAARDQMGKSYEEMSGKSPVELAKEFGLIGGDAADKATQMQEAIDRIKTFKESLEKLKENVDDAAETAGENYDSMLEKLAEAEKKLKEWEDKGFPTNKEEVEPVKPPSDEDKPETDDGKIMVDDTAGENKDVVDPKGEEKVPEKPEDQKPVEDGKGSKPDPENKDKPIDDGKLGEGEEKEKPGEEVKPEDGMDSDSGKTIPDDSKPQEGTGDLTGDDSGTDEGTADGGKGAEDQGKPTTDENPKNDAGRNVNPDDYDEGANVVTKDGTEFTKKDGKWEKTGEDYGPLTPPDKGKEGLEGSEGGFGGDDAGGEDGESKDEGGLGGFIGDKKAGMSKKSDFEITKTNTEAAQTQTKSDQAVKDADRTRDQGGSEAQTASEKSAAEAAKKDSNDSWGKAIADAVEGGVKQGGQQLGAAVGSQAAGSAAGSIFGTGDKGGSDDSSGKAGDETASTGVAGGTSKPGKEKNKPGGGGSSGQNPPDSSGSTSSDGVAVAGPDNVKVDCDVCGYVYTGPASGAPSKCPNNYYCSICGSTDHSASSTGDCPNGCGRVRCTGCGSVLYEGPGFRERTGLICKTCTARATESDGD